MSEEKDKFCVYDDSIVPYMRQYAKDAQEAILKARAMFPDCDVGTMFSMLAHRVATVAWNAATKQPLDRIWTESPVTSYAVPEAAEKAPDGYAVLMDDKASAPKGYWFTGCYVHQDAAESVRETTKSSRVVPIRFLCLPQEQR